MMERICIPVFEGRADEDYGEFVMSMCLYHLGHKKEERQLLGPRIVMQMKGELRKKLTMVDPDTLATEDSYKVIDAELQAMGYQEDKKKQQATNL